MGIWLEQLMQELKELLIKYNKLERYIGKREGKTIDLLNIQLSLMKAYAEILAKRLLNEGITFQEIEKIEEQAWEESR